MKLQLHCRSADDGEDPRRKMSVHRIWDFIEQARNTKVSMMKLAEIRETDRDGGVKPASVYLWQRKLLSMYKQESSLSFLNVRKLTMVTDSSHHSTKDWLVSLFYNSSANCFAHATAQFVNSAKILRPGQYDLMPEVERLAARREIERLSTLKFFQAVSSQCFKLAGLQITDFQPDSQLLSMLAPLNPGDQATFRGAEWEVIRAEDPATVHSMRFDAQSADMIPMLHILMDQGSIGCAANAFSLDQNLLVHYSYDKIHRLHRDIKGPLRGQLHKNVLLTTFMWTLNYTPFGSGGFFSEKQDVLESFLQSNNEARLFQFSTL